MMWVSAGVMFLFVDR